ncbi:MAG: hypothetical protein AB7R89_26590 [Dehalococcoidia bacterium]
MTRIINRLAWLCLGVLALAAAGLAVYLINPLGESGQDGTASVGTNEADAGDGTVAPASPAPSVQVPLRRALVNDTVDQVHGHAFTLHTITGGTERILLQPDAIIAAVTTSSGAASLTVGDWIQVTTKTISRDPFALPEDTGQVTTINVPYGASLSPAPSPSAWCPPVYGVRIGTVLAVGDGHLRLETPCGEETLDMPPAVEVRRYRPVAVTDLAAGQQVTVGGERLPDGSLSGRVVHISE